VDIQSLPAQVRAIVTIIRAASQQIQDELKQRCMAGGMRLFCNSGGEAGLGQFQHPGWLKGMFKGMFKGNGKGMCKGNTESADNGWQKGHHWHNWGNAKGWGKHGHGEHPCRAAWKGKGLGKGMWSLFADWAQQQQCASMKEHHGITCDGCEQSPVTGVRYRSLEWPDYDLCEKCHAMPDRQTSLGVNPKHRFESIPPPEVQHEPSGDSNETSADCASAEQIEACLTFIQSFGIDLKQAVPKLALAGLEVVQQIGKEELFPLLDPLTSLAQQENPDIHNLAGPIATIFETIKAAPVPVQHELMIHFGRAAHAILAEVSADAANLVKTLMSKGKGKGKCGKGWSGKCGKGWGKRSWHGGESQTGLGGCPKRAKLEHDSSVHDAALSSLLAHPDIKVRDAAQQALRQAASAATTPNPNPNSQETVASYSALATEPVPYVMSALASDTPLRVSAILNGEPAAEIHSDAISLSSLETRDVTPEWQPILSQFNSMKQAFLLGRVFLDSGATHPSVMAVHFVLQNDGNACWPANTTLCIAAGNPLGCEKVDAGEVPIGSVLEVTLKLELPSGLEATRSAWSLESNGEPFGPLLILEVFRS